MSRDDEQVAALLRQFQPKSPRQLPVSEPRPRVVWVSAWAAVAAAAAVVLFAANLRFMPMASLVPASGGPRLTIGGTRGLIDADPATLDRALLEASKDLLPDVQAPESALQPFARP
jgi:hypothetical protein